MISFNSSLLKSVEIKTSWAVFPFLAIALYPFIVFTDNLIINLEEKRSDLQKGKLLEIPVKPYKR